MTDAPRQPSPWRAIALAAVAFFCLRLLTLVTSGWSAADEAWILQIASRTSHGEALYRDVFFNCTPLVIYLSRAVCFFAGTSAMAMKALNAAIEAAELIATIQLLASLQPAVGWRSPGRIAVLALVMFAIPGPMASHLYNDLAALLILLTALAVVRWRKRPLLGMTVLIGVLLGLTFSEKQNIGMYLAVATAFSMAMTRAASPLRRAQHLVVVALAGGITVAIVFLPTLVSGGMHDLLVDTFLMKGQYLHVAGINYFAGFPELAQQNLWHDPINLIAHLIFPVTLLAAGAFTAGLLQRTTRSVLLVAAPFVLVLVIGIYPRADVWHVGTASPAAFIVLAVVSTLLPRPRAVGGLTALVGSVASVALLVLAATQLVSPNYTFSRLPHLRGILLTNETEARLTSQAAQLAALPKPFFILFPEASGLHLISNTQNPTPWDYPISSELPPGAQEQIIADLRAGRIKTVICVPRELWYSALFVPEKVQSMVERECPLIGQMGAWEVRQSPERP